MLYLSGCIPSKPELQQALVNAGVGALLTPFSQRNCPDGWTWAADNGCFGTQWNEHRWLSWLKSFTNPGDALFATVPDTVGNHQETLVKWSQWNHTVKNLGYRTAFVLQDGAQENEVPWSELDALFIGGTTEYKLSDDSRRMVRTAKTLGKWVHMGRVNSRKRIELAHHWGCDSVDGTFLAFGPDINTPKLIEMMNMATQPMLF